MKPVGLRGQIILSMMMMALGVTVLVLATSFVFYHFMEIHAPEMLIRNALLPSPVEWLWIGCATSLGLAFAVLAALTLSRRILMPLNSVINAIRRIVKGDLAARACPVARDCGEASVLAGDFNMLAEQLQKMTRERAFWNAAVSHELRTPVTILRGRLRGLYDGVFESDQKQFGSLLAQVENMIRSIEDLHIVNLMDGDHLRLSMQSTVLRAEVLAVVALYEDILHERGQTIVLALDELRVCCDPVRIRQALMALLENVHCHAVAGQVRIEAGVQDGMACLSVEDEGPGISKEFLPHVFTAFRRARDHQASGGSGLGLAVVEAIARAHRGTASCQSTSAGGTRFALRWPAQYGDAE